MIPAPKIAGEIAVAINRSLQHFYYSVVVLPTWPRQIQNYPTLMGAGNVSDIDAKATQNAVKSKPSPTVTQSVKPL